MKNTKKLLVIIILLLLLIFGTIGLILLHSNKRPISNRELSNSQQNAALPDKNTEENMAYTEIVGFGKLTISSTNPNINLINSEENDVYLSFDVFYNDELIYQSGLIEPGKMEQVNIYNLLDAGEHTLTYSIGSYSLETKEVYWAGIQQKQEIYVKK